MVQWFNSCSRGHDGAWVASRGFRHAAHGASSPTTRHDRLLSAQASMEVEAKDSAKEGEWWAWWNERIRSCQA
jgi:hypothetical protein